MAAGTMPRILFAGNPASDEIRALLEKVGFPVSVAGLSGIDPAEVVKSQLILLEVSPQTTTIAQALCRRWRIELGEQFVPIVWLCFEAPPKLVTGALDSGADVCLPRTTEPEALLAQLRAMLRIQHNHSRLNSRASESALINQRLQNAYQQIDTDLELTRRIHRSFLPRELPNLPHVKFGICYRPRSRVGGDFYDVFRLDEEHLGIYVADTIGRGLPASSLLSIFIKRAMQTKEITGKSYRLIPPGEVLGRLNRELAMLGLEEPPFVSILYLQLNCRDGRVCFARAGIPSPLLVPEVGDPEYWTAQGPMLGVMDATYVDHTRQMRPGNRLLLFTDGVHPPESTTITAATDPLVEMVCQLRGMPLQPFVDLTSRRILEASRQTEDFTILAVEYQ